jgi:pimeloyl-ACP methyl ester carboxylesterase
MARARFVRRGLMSVASLTTDPVPDDLLDAWLTPLHDRRIRRDAAKAMRDISPKHTLAAAERLPLFDKPVLIAWGTRDKFFVMEDAERLAATFPNARLERVEGARTFVSLDAPERLAELIVEHVGGARPDSAEVAHAAKGVNDDG